ncbi:sortase [Sulfurovum sp. XGS-02]|uniref:sortase n=1 Tax=Sulfurovum sp. XGS-02 TaxID=2925411 RepID=UPI00206D2C09|nr:sortase [Sulfurovum sp. XGS-02]UPT78320.1 sortase [Sulfurovum sp. XGS-02]
MATLGDHSIYVDLDETEKYIPFLDWVSPSLICVFGAILVVFGLWLYWTVYWDLRNAPAFHKKLKDLEIKEKNKEELGFGDRVNLKIPRIATIVSKISMISGLIAIVIGCISKIVF